LALPRRFICGVVVFSLTLCLDLRAAPQDGQEVQHGPVYVTARVFQARAKKAEKPDVSNQVFRLRTAQLTDDEKWLTGIQKAYPDFEIGLLQTHQLRVFRSPRPAAVVFGNQAERNLELLVAAAQSPGDGVTPGLSLIPQVEYHFGDDRRFKPISLALQPIEAEAGMTYFFATTDCLREPRYYLPFLRPDLTEEALKSDDFFFVFALSVETSKPAVTARLLDAPQSAAWQASATKKVPPELPAAWLKAAATVRVRVEVTPDGRVAQANIVNSTLPEANRAVLAAARQWEFPTAPTASNQQPVSALLTFTFTAPKPAPKPTPTAASPAAPKRKARGKASRPR
jgi:TonB family protein